ncbi:LacI family DNA-binding transcriptional regulator [Marinifilum sp.]|uniref:LacI family DNA-binding transcriptional regulator n=1 Tax=Marinifilum sp. TaxID=2033137 RepID=UPI003BAD3EC6
MKHITIKDIAKKLNLSISTVSRAFNDKYDIRKETKELILETAKELNYHPNPIAKKLIQQRSFNIGIVVPEFINDFFPKVIIGAQEILFEKGYQVLITQANQSIQMEKSNVKTLVDNMVDGLIISLMGDDNVEYYQELIESGLPIVCFNRTNENLKTPKVIFDDYKWSFFATEHLIHEGYKRIYHLAGPSNLSLSKNRKLGFIDANKKHKIELTENQIVPAGFMMEDGKNAAEELIAKNDIPDAIFAANDPAAIGAMKVFKEHGYKIPEDIAFVGFSESGLALHVDPPLTSVEQPTTEIGRSIARLLIQQIENPNDFKPQTLILNGKLNIRQSSKAK